MRLRLLSCLPLTIAILWVSQSFAEPWTFSCRGAITKLSKIQRTVQTLQREVQQAQSAKTIAFAELEICKPGGTVLGSRLTDCVMHRVDLPLKVKDAVAAQQELEEAVLELQEVFDRVHRVCLERP